MAIRALMGHRDKCRLPLVLPMIFRALGIALVIILGVATVLGLFVARRATGRVATLREAARRVGEGDLGVRVSPRGKDELDELGRAFDRMVAELGETRSRLEAAGFPIRTDAELPGYRRFYTEDPFGNRLECLERIDGTRP